jgi:hypothetical protein
MGPAESITCFAFSTYIGFLLLKGFDNSDYYPLDKVNSEWKNGHAQGIFGN